VPGLVGFESRDIERKLAVEVGERMQNLITHKEFYIRDTVFNDGIVCASRSHINAVQVVPQPYSQNGIHVWLDGEFYNPKELIKDGNFLSGNDAELLHNLYASDITLKFLRQIDGGYAAVIYDAPQRKIHLISDRYGRQHIYWMKSKDRFAWASELKAFSALPGFTPEIDPDAIYEFFGIGYMLGDRTWFKGINLMPAASVITLNMQSGTYTQNRYWWWNEIKAKSDTIDYTEAAAELGRIFINTVERLCDYNGDSVSVLLSGGRDSRAILAAMPQKDKPIHAYTFGQKNSEDVSVAARCMRLKRGIHHIRELTESNWILTRRDGVWWTDGQLDMMHMHGSGWEESDRNVIKVMFHGAGGGLVSGWTHRFELSDVHTSIRKRFNNEYVTPALYERVLQYIINAGSPEVYYIDNRFRNFISLGLKLGGAEGVQLRIPFFGNEVMEFVHGIPFQYKKGTRFYRKMLLQNFPGIFLGPILERSEYFCSLFA
jgi:asparagine synthase (glutamine-hydrolysing)